MKTLGNKFHSLSLSDNLRRWKHRVAPPGTFHIYWSRTKKHRRGGDWPECWWETAATVRTSPLRWRTTESEIKGVKNGWIKGVFRWQIWKEGNVLFNDALNTFYFRLHGVMDHSDSERGNPLPPHGLLFPNSSKGSFICTIPQTG